MSALDLEAVQAFVLVADLKSFTRAAEAMDTTQSAVSLKIKRLEHDLGRRLLDRTPRLVRLSADGSTFLGAARDLVGNELPGLLRRMSASDPGLLLELRVDVSRDVLDAFDRGELDAAIVLRHDHKRRGGEVLFDDSFGWMAAPDFVHRPGAPLRLATQAEPCGVRAMAVEALDRAGVAWTEVFIGGGVATIGAAVSAGLAVAALAHRVAPAGTVDVGPRLGLPALPSRDVMLYATAFDPQARRALRTLAAAFKAAA